MPEISVCIPTYNRKDYLKEALKSVFEQSYKDFEVIVMDDGSNDGTKEFVGSLDYPVNYHWQENAGDAAARNKMIELAEGKYITFLDSDDMLLPDALEKLVERLKDKQEDAISYGSYYRIDKNGEIYGKCKRKAYNGDIFAELFQSMFVHSCGTLFPKKVLIKEGGFDTKMKRCAVYLFLLNLAKKYKFYSVEEPVFKRRRHSGNELGGLVESRIIQLNVLEKIYFENDGKERIPEKTAEKRLSKESYRVAKAAMTEGDKDTARKYFDKSLDYKFNMKSFLKRLKT